MMSEGFQFIDIIFFAVIAGFILLRLRGVLGRRTGHQPPPAQRRGAAESNDNVVQLAERESADELIDQPAAEPGETEEEPEDDIPDEDPTLSAGLAQIGDANSDFTSQGFLDGALAAFEIVIEAFAAGDTERLNELLDDDVYRPFSRVIDEREKAGQSHETTLISIDENVIIEAGMNGRMAFVTVRFVTQQINVTRDADDHVVGGDPSHVATVIDLWTFERDSRSRNPNWKLAATRSPN